MGSAFWNVDCSSLRVEHCVVVGVNDFAAGCTSAVWQPGRVPSVIHMILFGIDQAVIHPLPISSPCPPPVLLSSAPGQGWNIRKTAWAKTSFVFRSIQKLPNSQLQHFPFWVFSHLPSPLSFFTLHILFFPPSYLLFLFAGLQVSLILFLTPSSISIYERALMGL